MATIAEQIKAAKISSQPVAPSKTPPVTTGTVNTPTKTPTPTKTYTPKDYSSEIKQ